MKSTVGVCFLFFLLLEAIRCEGCWKEERHALFGLHSRFDLPYSWDGPDCCQWQGVMCNSSTGRVAKLDISDNLAELYRTLNYSDFVVFKDLKNLDLSWSGIYGCAGTEVFETLSSKLPNLEVLDISGNPLTNDILPSLGGFTSLKELHLAGTYLDSDLHIQGLCSSLRNLEILDLSSNNFDNSDITSALSGLSSLNLQTWIPKFKLQELIVSSTTETKSLPLPNFLLYQNNLTNIDLSGWKLEGDFPHWLLENNTKMTKALFRNCSFTGTFQLPMRPLPNIQTIDVSDNTVNGQIPSNNISSIYPNLHYLYLSGNNIQGSIPSELGQMSLLYSLDLSENQLSGKIPENIFADGHPLRFLKLSNNMLEGPILNIPYGLETLLLSHNRFTGRLPSNIFNSSVVSLDVSNNHLVGKIPSYVDNFSTLTGLYMSNNHFEGSIPIELAELEDLTYLDLSQNNLTGHVPSFANSPVKFMHLNNNHLSGLSKRMFNENSSLVMLDLSYNEISSKIQDMIRDLSYTRLNFLLLKGNHFIGDIPKQLCQLTDLSILDLSHNNFSGAIPNCLGKMPFEVENSNELLHYFYGWLNDDFSIYRRYAQLPNVQEKTNFTSKKRTDTYMGSILVYMSGIDLSHNKLKGNIPYELGNLTEIRTLNLSHNDLTGQIPATFSHLVLIESLDLSFNMLNGQIPPQLTTLTSLEVFSVAQNNLSGPTPEFKEQFSTFDESSYEGNPFLCGLPLPKSCNPPPIVIPNDSVTDGHYDTLVDMNFFCVSFVVSYTSALLVTATALYINPYWRQAWFYYMELDMSVTTKSSVAMYIIGPLTYPLLLAVSDMLSTNSKAVQLP
ncbi:hypothetical protein JHK87_018443 [Glycine soja]|nr:hypothetical protein JHK87_018443 [Glycine soja]